MILNQSRLLPTEARKEVKGSAKIDLISYNVLLLLTPTGDAHQPQMGYRDGRLESVITLERIIIGYVTVC